MIRILISLIMAYLLGSMTPSYWIVRLAKGLDIRKYGSGNPGMTNVYRLMGLGPAVMVFLLDIAKGFAAVYWFSRIAQPALPTISSTIAERSGVWCFTSTAVHDAGLQATDAAVALALRRWLTW